MEEYNINGFIGPEEIFSRVKSSLKSYDDLGMFLIDEYYKVIDTCNSILGRKINPKKEKIIKIKNYVAELPEDFFSLELALVVGNMNYSERMPYPEKSMTLEGRIPTPMELSQAANLDKCCNFKLTCGKVPVLTCKIEHHYYEFQETHITRLTEKRYCSSNCFNLNSNSPYMMEIVNRRYIQIDSFKEGSLYINYTSKTSGEGNIPMCLDHPKILNYYEKAIKLEILKDLYINKRLEVTQALQLATQDLQIAQGDAIAFISIPEVYEHFDINNALKRRYRAMNHFIYPNKNNNRTKFYGNRR